MSYLSDFEHSFMRRTLQILQDYSGDHDATLLINCLLGLLIVPKEVFSRGIPAHPLSAISEWGIDPNSIENVGKVTEDHPKPATIRGLVINLRHSVAHFDLEPISDKEIVRSFNFKNESSFDATITLGEMRSFIWYLAKYLDELD